MTSSFHISRRTFLKRCATVAATAGVPAWFVERDLALAAPAARRLGPNDRPGIALVGCGGRGRGDAGNASRFGDILAVCDVDAGRAESAAKQFTKDGKAPVQFTDFRKVMERDDVHVIVQATPDHWHTLVNLAAVSSGKDVYGEKPLTLTIDEGKRPSIRRQRGLDLGQPGRPFCEPRRNRLHALARKRLSPGSQQ